MQSHDAGAGGLGLKWLWLAYFAPVFTALGFTGRLTLRGALYAGAGWFVAFWLYYAVERGLGLAGIRMFWDESGLFGLDSALRVAVVVLATIIIAPLAEETIYRGYVLKTWLSKLGAPAAAVLSALIFASVHIGIGLGLTIYVFLGALILACLYLRFRNIYACVLMHLLNNIVAYIVIPLTLSR